MHAALNTLNGKRFANFDRFSLSLSLLISARRLVSQCSHDISSRALFSCNYSIEDGGGLRGFSLPTKRRKARVVIDVISMLLTVFFLRATRRSGATNFRRRCRVEKTRGEEPSAEWFCAWRYRSSFSFANKKAKEKWNKSGSLKTGGLFPTSISSLPFTSRGRGHDSRAPER